jgi:hypothetical protein
MISNRRGTALSEGLLVPSCDPSPKETSPQIPPVNASNASVSDRQHRSGAARRAVQRTALDSDDRRVFNIWVRWVTAFYSLLIISLLVAMRLAAPAPAGMETVSAAPTIERSSPDLHGSRIGSGK